MENIADGLSVFFLTYVWVLGFKDEWNSVFRIKIIKDC